MNSERDEVTFYASRSEATQLLVISLGFVITGWFLRADHPVMAWVSIGFFGLGIPVAIVRLVAPRSTYLRVDREGLELVEGKRKHRIKWSDVERFEIGSLNAVKMFSIIYSPRYTGESMGRSIAHSLAGMEGAIPDIYTATLEEIASTLNEWRSRSAREPERRDGGD